MRARAAFDTRASRRCRGKFAQSTATTDPGLTLLESATLWLDASDPGSDPQKIQNKGTGGSVLDARFGSTTGVDSNDPLLLTHSGTNYLYIPDTGNADYASIPAAASGPLDITGDIDLIAKVALDDWTPTNQKAIITRGAASGTAAWRLYVNNTGYLQISWVDSGAAAQSLISDAAPSVANGAVKWIRGTLDLDNGAGDCVARFYTSDDGSSWTQLGTDRTLGATSTMRTGTAGQVRLGSYWSGTNPCIGGKLYRAIIKSGIDGTIALDADFTANTNQSSFTESSSNAATVTINRATSGRKSVMVVRPTLLFGTDDYLEVADNDLLDVAAGERLTALIVMRDWATVSGNTCFVVKYSGAFDEGWGLIRDNAGPHRARGYLESGASNVSSTAAASWTAGTLVMNGLLIDRTAQTVATSNGSTIAATSSIAALGTLANSGTLRIGRNQVSGDYLDGEVMQVAVFKGSATLTSTELGQIMSYLGVS